MKNLGCFKDFKVRPLDGAFDARTPSGELNFYDFRVVLNMDLTEQRKRCRMGGWQKLLSDSPFGFNNQDLHDQMLACQGYYEAFSETVTYGPVLTGYTYPVWYPGQSFPDQFDSEEIPETYYGYPPDFYGDYPYYPALGPFICESYVGYPYNGDGDSYFELCYGSIVPAYSEEGYGSGTPVPTYLGPYSYDYNYCGNYAYNRDHLCREAITLLYEAVSVGGRRKLVAGTKSRLYVLNERAGNWRILLDGQSGAYASDNCECAQRRFKVAQVGNIVIVTNNFDPVMTWEIDAGPSGCDMWSTEFVSDLQGLGIQKAGVVAAWQGFAFLADVQVNNERHGSRIYWSDLNDPRSWAPGGGSAAGFVDLGLGERVVAISPIGGQLRVYTTRGDEKAIYHVAIVGGTEILSFNEIYRGPDGIEYENSLVNTGNSHVWLSSSGIMVLGEYDRSPQRIEWIYKADGVFYNGLPGEWLRDFDGLSGFGSVNKEVCHNVVGGYNSERKQIWFSWPTDDNTCANMSLVLNPVYRAATLVDHGFTAFLTYRPDYTVALRDFLAQYAGCDPSTMVMPKEGSPLPVEIGYMPAYIRNETEDPDLPPDENSMCGYLGGLTLEDLCEACGVESLFVMASALDKTLKEFTPNQCFRERYVECSMEIFVESPDPITEGDTVALTAVYSGTVGSVSFAWFKDGVLVSNGAGVLGTVSGATTATLTIANATTEASGNYTVTITDAMCSRTSPWPPIGGSGGSGGSPPTDRPPAIVVVEEEGGSTTGNHLLSGLLAFWRFEEESGNAEDASGNGKTLTEHGSPTFASGGGIVGNCRQFSSSDQTDYYDRASDPDLDLSSGLFTIAGWVDWGSRALEPNDMTILARGNADTGEPFAWWLLLDRSGPFDDVLYFIWAPSGTFDPMNYLDNSVAFTPGGEFLSGFNFVTVRCDGTTIKLSVTYNTDSARATEATAAFTGIPSITQAIMVGAIYSGLAISPVHDMGGNIDEIGIWNRALSDCELDWLFTAKNHSFTFPDFDSLPCVSP